MLLLLLSLMQSPQKCQDQTVYSFPQASQIDCTIGNVRFHDWWYGFDGVARSFYSAGLSLKFVEDDQWIRFIVALESPGFWDGVATVNRPQDSWSAAFGFELDNPYSSFSASSNKIYSNGVVLDDFEYSQTQLRRITQILLNYDDEGLYSLGGPSVEYTISKNNITAYDTTVTPEPKSIVLLLLGLSCIILVKRRIR